MSLLMRKIYNVIPLPPTRIAKMKKTIPRECEDVEQLELHSAAAQMVCGATTLEICLSSNE